MKKIHIRPKVPIQSNVPASYGTCSRILYLKTKYWLYWISRQFRLEGKYLIQNQQTLSNLTIKHFIYKHIIITCPAYMWVFHHPISPAAQFTCSIWGSFEAIAMVVVFLSSLFGVHFRTIDSYSKQMSVE